MVLLVNCAKNEKGVVAMTQRHNEKIHCIMGPRLQGDGTFVVEEDELGLFSMEISVCMEDLSAIEQLCLEYEQGLVATDGGSLRGVCRELECLADCWLALATG